MVPSLVRVHVSWYAIAPEAARVSHFFPKEPAMDRYLTPPEVSEILRIPVVTLYGWKHRNYGPPTISLGRLLRYPEQGLESWIASRHD